MQSGDRTIPPDALHPPLSILSPSPLLITDKILCDFVLCQYWLRSQTEFDDSEAINVVLAPQPVHIHQFKKFKVSC